MIGTRCALIRSAASTAQRKQGTPRLAQPAAQTRAQKILRMAHALLRPTLAEAVRAIAAALSVARVGLERRGCRACNGAHVLVFRASAAPPGLVAEVLQRVRIDPAGAQRRVKCKPLGPPYPRGPIIGGAAAAFERDGCALRRRAAVGKSQRRCGGSAPAIVLRVDECAARAALHGKLQLISRPPASHAIASGGSAHPSRIHPKACPGRCPACAVL